jgi:oxygen-independent coproporphyrinogen-3 oxidase
MDHFAKKTDELAMAAKNKTLWRNFQGYTTRSGTELIGFGLTSISDICGRYAQNTKKLIDYFRKNESGALSTVKGWKLTDKDKKRRTIIRNLFCNGIAEITQISDLGSRISDLQNDGLVEIRPSRLIVTPLGRLFIRNIASALDEYLDPSSTFSKAV